MSTFTFEEKRHRYFLDGKALTGITTVLNVVAKPNLIGWAARMATEYVRDNLKDLNDLEQVLELAKNAHTRKKEEGGSAGTDVHALIEAYIKGLIEKCEGKANQANYLASENPNGQVQQFIAWARENEVEFLASEKRMYSEELWLGGTCDAIALIKGKKYVVDFKTQDRMWDRVPFLQMAGYLILLEEMGEKDFHGSCVVLLPKKGKLETFFTYDLENEKQAFLSTLKLYRYLQEKI